MTLPVPSPASPVTEMAELLEFIEAYYTGASRPEMGSYADWFSLPTFIDASSLPGRIRSVEPLVFTTADEILAWREEMLSAYRDLDYGSLAARVRQVWLLTGTVAVFVGDVQRLRVDGSEINRSCHLYVLRKVAGAWRILATLPADEVEGPI